MWTNRGFVVGPCMEHTFLVVNMREISTGSMKIEKIKFITCTV